MTEAPMAAGIALLSAAGAALIRARFGSSQVMRAGFVAAVVATGFLAAMWFVVTPCHAAENLARIGALIAMVMTLCAAGVQWTCAPHPPSDTTHAFVRVARRLALLCGVMSGTLLTIVLGVRCTYVMVELLTVLPTSVPREYGFTRDGAGSLALLLIACAVGYGATAASALAVCMVVLAALIGTWLSLQAPTLYLSAAAGVTRSLGFTLLGLWFAVVLVFSAGMTFSSRRPRGAPDSLNPPTLGNQVHPSVGWQLCTALLAVALIAHVTYALAVPLEVSGAGVRVAPLLGCVSAVIGSAACFALASRRHSGSMADAAFGLLALSLASAAVAAIPAFPPALVERYPVVFNAAIAGLAVAAALGAVLAHRWTQHAQADPDNAITVMFRAHAKRAIFICGAAALTIGGMMAFWPRLEGIATPDFSLPRVSAGFGANLLLFVVLLGCARRFQRPTYYVLAGLAFVSAAAFMVVRILPFTPRFG